MTAAREVGARRDLQLARAWHAVFAALTIAAMITQLVLTSRGIDVLVVDGRKPDTHTRIIRFFSYFTVQANILVVAASLTLIANPVRDGRWWRMLRLTSLFGITITGIIYVTLLRPIVNLGGLAKLTDIQFHYVTPLAAVIGWLLFGPRRRIDENTILLALVWPVLYMIYVAAYGAGTHWYPYPFVDVARFGYVVVLRNALGICVLFIGVGFLYRYADRLLTRWFVKGPAEEG